MVILIIFLLDWLYYYSNYYGNIRANYIRCYPCFFKLFIPWSYTHFFFYSAQMPWEWSTGPATWRWSTRRPDHAWWRSGRGVTGARALGKRSPTSALATTRSDLLLLCQCIDSRGGTHSRANIIATTVWYEVLRLFFVFSCLLFILIFLNVLFIIFFFLFGRNRFFFWFIAV